MRCIKIFTLSVMFFSVFDLKAQETCEEYRAKQLKQVVYETLGDNKLQRMCQEGCVFYLKVTLDPAGRVNKFVNHRFKGLENFPRLEKKLLISIEQNLQVTCHLPNYDNVSDSLFRSMQNDRTTFIVYNTNHKF